MKVDQDLINELNKIYNEFTEALYREQEITLYRIEPLKEFIEKLERELLIESMQNEKI